uniref:UBX domain-containing protein 1 n=1 Tax=Phallusia mammillata TaxID=59560 RepID=A0A6F9DVJ4_9ASCI|nr:UBX domain-containing protein 1 [Phallusia mammillata]
MSGVDTLVEMGFLQNRAEKAWAIMGERGGVQAAMEWLLQHNEDPDIDEPYKPPEGNVLGKNEGGEPSVTSETSINVEEQEQAPEQKALTAEEKAQKFQEVQEKMKQRRLEREEEERKREIENEKARRKQGQDISKIKADIHFKEAQRLAEIRKREKKEDLIARQKIKEQIARDRADKKAQEEKSKQAKVEQAASVAASSQQTSSPVKKDHTHARLQMRLPNGSQMVQQFNAQEPLSAVRLYVELNRKDGNTDPFDLMTAFPKKVFTSEEMEMPLSMLGLCPSAVLMVTKPH